MQKWGLVLSGGGGRGSYHIGVWKYLKEVGLDNNISAISGTSVGALNSCLFALNNYELSERIWTNEIENKILSFKVEDILERMSNIKKLNLLVQFFLPYSKILASTGIFSREGLKSIIDEFVDLDFVSNCSLPVYVCATNVNTLKAEYFKLNRESRSDIIDMLLASSAIPGIFPLQNVKGDVYWDGCLFNNSPITPLYDEGCTNIIVVKLDATEILKDRRDNFNIYEICPQDSLGEVFTGVLDFSPSGANRRIEQGYNDAKAILEPVINIANTGNDKFRILREAQRNEEAFLYDRQKALEERARLKENLNKTIDSLSNFEEAKRLYLDGKLNFEDRKKLDE